MYVWFILDTNCGRNEDIGVEQIKIDQRFAIRTAILSILLLWPLLVFGQPSYFPDSASYQKGGRVAVTFALTKLHLSGRAEPTPAPVASAPTVGSMAPRASDKPVEATAAKGTRSITYSIVSYILRGPGQSMVYLAIFHALALAFAAVALFEAIAGRRGMRDFATMAIGFAFLTNAAPVTTVIIPDVFAGIIIAVQLLLTFYWRRLSWPMALALIALGAFAVSSHASHPPLALGMATMGTLWLFWFRRTDHVPFWRSAAMNWAPSLLGVALVLASGFVGFGEVSVAPKRYPLTLARAIDNGPARWYLQDHCDPPEYAVCELYGTNIPKTVDEFLWLPNGIAERATPEQMDRIRAEESRIIWRTTLAYPGTQLATILHDIPQQMILFDIKPRQYFGTIERQADGTPTVRGIDTPRERPLLRWLNRIAVLVVLISTVSLALRVPRMTKTERGMLLMLFAGLLINATVCALFSGVAARYQARVIMILPLVAIAVFVSNRREKTLESA